MLIVACDKDLNILDYDIPYTNLVWTDRWYDFGEFQMQVALDVYDPDWAFLTSPDSERVAMVQKREFSSDNGGTMLLSGFFAEKALDRVVFTTLFNTWDNNSYDLGSLLRHLLTLYYTEKVAWGFLKIVPKGSGTFNDRKTTRDFRGQLGNEFYNCLQDFGLSQKVVMGDDGCEWHIMEGSDLSEAQSENHRVVLSSAYGDFASYKVVIDDSSYKNVAVCTEGQDRSAYYVYRRGETVPVGMQSQIEVNTSASGGENPVAVFNRDGRNRLNELQTVFDIDVDLNDPNLIDDWFKLGDIITVKIDEMELKADTRIIEVTRTYSTNGNSTQLGFGNKRISNIRRAMK